MSMRLLVLGAILFAPALLAPAPAVGGERTTTPPKWRGDVDFMYRGMLEAGSVQDRAAADRSYALVGNYTEQSHGLDITAKFAVYHGITVGIDIPLVFHSRRRWIESFDMRFDPGENKGTMVATRPLSAEALDESPAARDHVGIGDLGIVFRFVPFAERGVPGREAPATVALDVGIRAPSGENHDAVRPDGTAGPGRGGPALVLGMTASRRVKTVEPYVAVEAIFSAPYRQQTLDADGLAIPATDGDPSGIEFDPADSIGVRFGTEVALLEVAETEQRMGLDIGFGIRYVGPHEASSGTWIPAPLEPTVGRIAVRAEHLKLDVGLGFRVRPRREVQVMLDMGAGWASPHTVERVDKNNYTVQTAPGTFQFFWGLGVRGRIR